MKTVLLIGLGNFGVYMAKKLNELGHQVLAVDRDEERINAILPFVTEARIGDSTNEEFLRSLGVDNFDLCFVALRKDFQNSLETTSLLKELGGKLVISIAGREVQEKFLLRNGADAVINPDRQMAEWGAIRYASNHLQDYVKMDDDCEIFEVDIPADWDGRTVAQLDVRKKHGISILGIKNDGKMNLSVTPDTVLREGGSLLVIGQHKAIQKCFRL